MFIGCVESSRHLLETLIESNVNIVGVITKSNSAYNSDFVDLSFICKREAIDYIYVNNINEDHSIQYIKNKEPDLIYCFGWSQLISNAIINIPTLGVIGFHPAELPYNRGRHPIIWALALGLKRTASTFFFITEGADDGDIVSQVKIPIEYDDNACTLYNKIMENAVIQIKTITEQFISDNIVRIPQDNSIANYWRKRTEKDGIIDWRMSAKSIYYLVRALTKPYDGACFIYQDVKYIVWAVKVIDTQHYENIENGKILKVYSDKSFMIKTGDGVLLVEDCDRIYLNEGDYLL